MKKGLKLLGCILCAALFFSCEDPSNNNGGGTSKPSVEKEKKTLTEQIDQAKNGTIDFEGAKFSEDASVDDTVTIKNLNMDGKTLTVSASGVVLENVNNATVVVVGGEVTLKNCSNIIKLEINESAFDTDDSEEIIIDASQIETIEINKDGIHLLLKDEETAIAEIIISAVDTELKVESAEGEDVPVIELLTITEEADNVNISGGKIESVVIETSADVTEEDMPVNYSEDTVVEKETVQKVPFKDGTASQYIEAAVKILTAGNSLEKTDMDLALSYFKKAYETEQTDETKLFYALAEVASISTDESVAKLLKENFGIINYPSSVNALLSGDWMKEYEDIGTYYAVEFKKDPKGNYVRGDLCSDVWKYKDSALRFNYVFEPYENYWLYSKNTYNGLWDIEPSATGNKMFYVDFNPSYIYMDQDGIDIEATYNELAAFRETYKDCFYSISEQKYVRLPSSVRGNNSKAVAPEFTIIDEDDPNYQATLFKSVQTTESVAYLMLSNLFTCNAEGFNKLIDNILNVYGTRFENAKALVADIKQESVTVPANIIKALELDEYLGESAVKIGKAEVDVLFSAMDIYKGLFQWFSSYDLSLDLNVLKNRVFQTYDQNGPYSSWASLLTTYTMKLEDNLAFELPDLFALTNGKTMTVRDAAAMDASKNTILNAVNTILASYKYITEESKLYPSDVKDTILEYAAPYAYYVSEFAKALEDESVFVVKTEAGKPVFAIDLGKFFTAGYLSGLVEKNSKGDVKFTVNSYMSGNTNEILPFKDNKEYEFDVNNFDSELYRVFKPEIKALDWEEKLFVLNIYGYAGLKLSKIMDLLPGMINLSDKMSQTYDETTGTLKIPFAISAWINIYKPLDGMEGEWFETGFDLTEFLKNCNAEDDDFINISVSRLIKTYSSIFTGRVFAGDVKTIKESGFSTYGIMNYYNPANLEQYITKSDVPEKYADVPDAKAKAGEVKLYTYSNMTGENPGSDLKIVIKLCKKPISDNGYYDNIVAYYDSETKKITYGYASDVPNQILDLKFSKVKAE